MSCICKTCDRNYRPDPSVDGCWSALCALVIAHQKRKPVPYRAPDLPSIGWTFKPKKPASGTVVQREGRKAKDRLTAFGLTLTLAGWEKRTGIPAKTIISRIERQHMAIDTALSKRVAK